jgi:MFS family permease
VSWLKRDSFRALRHRNFRLFLIGQGISLMGTWMTRLAMGWLVYRLTDSTFLLGVVSFASQIPTFILCPFAGVWLDRLKRREVLMVAAILAAVQSLALAALTLSNRVTIAEVIALAAMQGLINAFDVPARQSFHIQLVGGKEDLGNAIALNSAVVNGTRLLGPALAGLIIAAVGEGYCFLIDGISYLAVIASLLAVTIDPPILAKSKNSLLVQLKEGWVYVSTFGPIRTVMILFVVISFASVPYAVLMPVFATKILHGGPHTLGFLVGAGGLGALLAAMRLAGRKAVQGFYRVIFWGAVLMALGSAGFSFSRNVWLSMAFMVVMGYGMMQEFGASSTVIQMLVDDDKRGRVMSYWTMAFMGSVPLGSLIAGSVAPVIGAPGTVLVCGVVALLGAAWFWLKVPQLGAIPGPGESAHVAGAAKA